MTDSEAKPIRRAAREDFPAVAELMTRHNARPERRCIHSDIHADAEATCREMLGLEAQSELVALMAGAPLAALACEFDPEVGRGWLRGPFVDSDDSAAWEAQSAALFDCLLPNLPPSIRRLDSFLDVANERGNAFYLGRGFQRMREVHVYLARRHPERLDQPHPRMERRDLPDFRDLEALTIQPAHAAQVAELQEALFPGAYLTGEMLSRPAEGRRVFVLAEGDRVLGYICARADTVTDEAPEGTVEFLGVQPGARRRGLGERLLRLALRWLFDAQGQAAVNLTVNAELANARALYEKVGFRLKYTGVHTRLER